MEVVSCPGTVVVSNFIPTYLPLMAEPVRRACCPHPGNFPRKPPCRRARSSGCSTRRRRRCWRAWSASRSAAEHKPRSSHPALCVRRRLRCPPLPERRRQRQAWQPRGRSRHSPHMTATAPQHRAFRGACNGPAHAVHARRGDVFPPRCDASPQCFDAAHARGRVTAPDAWLLCSHPPVQQ